MYRTLRRGIVIVLIVSLGFTPMVPAAAKKKVALSAKNVTLKVGKQKKLSLKNTTQKVKWSISSGKKVLRLKSKKKKSVVIVAKKAGIAKVQAKLGKKKYICKVTVKKAESVVTKAPKKIHPTQKPTSTPKPDKTTAPQVEKDKAQVKALQELVQSIIDHSNVDDEPIPTPTRTSDAPENPGDSDGWEEPDDSPTRQISADVDDTEQYGWKNGKLTEIIWDNMGITGALSLEDFPELQTLICSNNKITKLDLNANSELQELYCSDNLLTGSKLFVTNCKKLMVLDCSSNIDENDNALTKLNISKMEELEYLNCSHNALTTLDVSNNKKLTELNCSDNTDLETLKMGNNMNLTILDCSTCAIEKLDISECSALEELKCNDNMIEALNVKNNPELKILNCELNSLQKLNTSNNPKLEELICSSNGYTDRSKNTPDIQEPDDEGDGENEDADNVTTFAGNSVLRLDVPIFTYSGDDETMDIDVSENTKLKILKCANNALSTLDISKNEELEYLDCSMNYLQTLNLSHNPKLFFLNCQNNDIAILDLTNLEQKLSSTKLYCDQTVEVFGNDK